MIKQPESEAEYTAMWQLNHAVFAAELHQHATHADHLLIDKFHHKNHYFIAKEGERVVGMICGHWSPPFSAVAKFGEALNAQLIPGATGEVRLFALAPDVRHTTVAIELAAALMTEMQRNGIRKLVISGIAAQKTFYEHVGFQVAGEPVEENGVRFYPMTADLDTLLRRNRAYRRYAR